MPCEFESCHVDGLRKENNFLEDGRLAPPKIKYKYNNRSG